MLASLLIFQPDSPPGNITPDAPDDHPSPFSPLPFSHLDPVNDLGLMEFMWPDSSWPPMNLFQLLEKSKKRAALPTNQYNLSQATYFMTNFTIATMVRDPKERLLSAFNKRSHKSDYVNEHCCQFHSAGCRQCRVRIKFLSGFLDQV
jgi:hypothetical protein